MNKIKKKAIVFDNSGTLLERYRVIKDLSNGKCFSNINSIELIDSLKGSALVVLQFNISCLSNIDPNMRLYDLIKEYNIDFDISYSNSDLKKSDILKILKNDSAIVKDIIDSLDILKKKVKHMELCNGSALIIDTENNKVGYTISSAGKLFSNVKYTIKVLQNRGIDIFIASGDRSGAIKKLTKIIGIPESHGYSTASKKRKCEIVRELQNKGYKVMMVGDAPNDLFAFKVADVSVLTVEQEEVSDKMFKSVDHIIYNISEVINIDF